MLETVRECLQDVYDVPALTDLMSRIAQRRVRLIDVETTTPSPFARPYCSATSARSCTRATARWPNAGRPRCPWTACCSPNCSAGSSCGTCSTPEVLAATARQLQHLDPDRAARDAEGIADLLRLLGPLTADELADRCTTTEIGGWLEACAPHAGR